MFGINIISIFEKCQAFNFMEEIFEALGFEIIIFEISSKDHDWLSKKDLLS